MGSSCLIIVSSSGDENSRSVVIVVLRVVCVHSQEPGQLCLCLVQSGVLCSPLLIPDSALGQSTLVQSPLC